MGAVSVVIPTVNEEKYIEPLLKTLKPQLKMGDELIVMDSHSSDNTAKIARKYTKNIFFVPRLGIGPAKTLGARRARNEVVAFLDADTIVPAGWLERVRRAFLSGADVFYGMAFFSSVFANIAALFLFMPYFFIAQAIFRVRTVPPNNCAFRKSIFLKVGGYGAVVAEDWDLAMRMKGMKNVKYCFDWKSFVVISDRRLRKSGVLKTIGGWILQSMRILTGNTALNSEDYGVAR